MAALPISNQSPNPNARKRMRRMSPHMDFTPMVDLGFLLITFFMLSTTLAKPVVMPLVMPEKTGGLLEPVKQSKVLTILMGSHGKVYWYEGLDLANMDSTGFQSDGLRQVILQKMKKVEQLFGLQEYQEPKTGATRLGSHLNVIIKPGKFSSYKNLVDALDEMNICRVRYYCIVDPTAEEASIINTSPQ